MQLYKLVNIGMQICMYVCIEACVLSSFEVNAQAGNFRKNLV